MTLRARRPHKYGAKACVIDGIRFASQKEGARYQALRLLEKAGEISDLVLQPEFPLVVMTSTLDGHVIGKYCGDFAYTERGLDVLEDVKGGKATQTPLWKWKVKHLKAQYGIQVKVV